MVNFNYYLKSILASTKDSVAAEFEGNVSLKNLSEYTEKLNDLRIHVNNVQSLWRKRLKINKKLIEVQPPEFKKQIYDLVYVLNSNEILIKQKQAINDYIRIWVQYLKYLRIAIARDEKESVKKIISKFMTSKLNMTYLIDQVSEFEDHVRDYEHNFNKLMHQFNIINDSLESKISMVFSPKSSTYFKNLRQSHKRQKYLIYHIGRNFINVLNTSYSKREINSLMNQKL